MPCNPQDDQLRSFARGDTSPSAINAVIRHYVPLLSEDRVARLELLRLLVKSGHGQHIRPIYDAIEAERMRLFMASYGPKDEARKIQQTEGPYSHRAMQLINEAEKLQRRSRILLELNMRVLDILAGNEGSICPVCHKKPIGFTDSACEDCREHSTARAWDNPPTWLFSYGSNHPEQLSQRLERPITVQEGAFASGWRRVFRGWSQKWQGGVASLEKKAGATVYGWATQVTPADLALLDRYEGVASGNYRRETIPITLQGSGKKVKAIVYIANSTQFNQPSRAYLEACAKTVGTFWSDDGRPVAVEDFAINPRKKCRRCSRPVRDSELCDSCAWTVAEQEETDYLDRHVAAPSVCEWCEGTGQYAGGICRACSINANPQDDDLRRLQREWKETRDPKVRGKLIRLLRRIGKKYVHPKSKRLRGTSRRLATLREIRIPSSWLQRIGDSGYRGEEVETVDTSITELSGGQVIYADLIHGSESTYVRVERHLRDRVQHEDPDESSDIFLMQVVDGQVVQMPPLVYSGHDGSGWAGDHVGAHGRVLRTVAPAESFVIRVVQDADSNPQDEDLRKLRREWAETRDPKVRAKLIRALRRAGKKPKLWRKSRQIRKDAQQLFRSTCERCGVRGVFAVMPPVCDACEWELRLQEESEPEADDFECRECGRSYVRNNDGTTNHVDEGGRILYDVDADHTPY